MIILNGQVSFIGVVATTIEHESTIRIFPEFCRGLRGIDAFSHLIVLYWLHQRDNAEERSVLQVYPRRHNHNVLTGVFACRSPSRPTPIALCVVELLHVNNCKLSVKGLDALNGSPIVDIKPYLPKADSIPNARIPEWTHHSPST
ncbi:MAG: tRNA (N6-threonylcarbamoyladenosine(37)-N6)-methyltransferase TrmO [Candidatus Bathyarchaeota archaeon]|nr:MAG: tRNA (N6-threonylcarbamoyladenosine(37)-N6)-methyltransferase TrmO [Candidatus Bathyarchaeota archaeon]